MLPPVGVNGKSPRPQDPIFFPTAVIGDTVLRWLADLSERWQWFVDGSRLRQPLTSRFAFADPLWPGKVTQGQSASGHHSRRLVLTSDCDHEDQVWSRAAPHTYKVSGSIGPDLWLAFESYRWYSLWHMTSATPDLRLPTQLREASPPLQQIQNHTACLRQTRLRQRVCPELYVLNNAVSDTWKAGNW